MNEKLSKKTKKLIIFAVIIALLCGGVIGYFADYSLNHEELEEKATRQAVALNQEPEPIYVPE